MTNDLPIVGTEDARSMAYAQEDGDRSGCWYPGKAAGEMLRTLVSERDALAVRVAELEAALLTIRNHSSVSLHQIEMIDAALTTPESKP